MRRPAVAGVVHPAAAAVHPERGHVARLLRIVAPLADVAAHVTQSQRVRWVAPHLARTLQAPTMLATAAALCQQFGLLTNDGLIVAVMQANGLTKIASNDADFDREPGLARYAPF